MPTLNVEVDYNCLEVLKGSCGNDCDHALRIQSIPARIEHLKKSLHARHDAIPLKLVLIMTLIDDGRWIEGCKELQAVLNTPKLRVYSETIRDSCTYNYALCLYHQNKYEECLNAISKRNDDDDDLLNGLRTACFFRSGDVLTASRHLRDVTMRKQTPRLGGESRGSGGMESDQILIDQMTTQKSKKKVCNKWEWMLRGRSGLEMTKEQDRGQERGKGTISLSGHTVYGSANKAMAKAEIGTLSATLKGGNCIKCRELILPLLHDKEDGLMLSKQNLDGAAIQYFDNLQELPAGLILAGSAWRITKQPREEEEESDESEEIREEFLPGSFVKKSAQSTVPTIANERVAMLILTAEKEWNSPTDYYKSILDRIPQFSQFQMLGYANLREKVAERMSEQHFHLDDVVIAKGSDRPGVYILLQGSAKIAVGDLSLNHIRFGCAVGFGMAHKPPKVATADLIVDSTHASFLHLGHQALCHFAVNYPRWHTSLLTFNDPVVPSQAEIANLKKYDVEWKKYKELKKLEEKRPKSRHFSKMKEETLMGRSGVTFFTGIN